MLKPILTLIYLLLTTTLYAQNSHSLIDSNYIKEMRANRIDTPIIDYGNSDGFVYIPNNVPVSNNSNKNTPIDNNKPKTSTPADKPKLND